MKPEFIKPIPENIRAKIEKMDKALFPYQMGACRFYSYLTKVKGELVKITVATKSHYSLWHCKQVSVHGVNSEKCWVKDLEYSMLGYRVGWYDEGLTEKPKQYESGWCYADFKYYSLVTATINPGFVSKCKQFQFSGHQFFQGDCIIKYLRTYKKYPQVEYLAKFGMSGLYDKVTILRRIAKDKEFCKWLVANKNEIAKTYNVGLIFETYKAGMTVAHYRKVLEFKENLKNTRNQEILQEFFGKDLLPFFAYLIKQNASPSSYIDYLKACQNLQVDMECNKNRFPKNFQHWHDKRIDEYAVLKARVDKEQRPEIYQKFAAIAKKYLTLQNCKQGIYAVLIAQSPADLVHEGEKLKHCVGKIGYEEKMIEGETLIFFIRAIERLDVPFVTVEYSPASKKVLQCYGHKNSKPDETVLNFVNKVWLPYANQTIEKMCA